MNAISSPPIQALWRADEIARATDGTRTEDGDWRTMGVSIDSRTVTPGDLFVAIVGPNADGHDYVAAALDAGAAGCVVTHCPQAVGGDAPLVLIDDTLRALEALGRAARARSGARIAAITGSVGKTGVKEMLRAALTSQGEVSATVGNLNNHWGLPLSLARLPASAAYGIFEMGMNHPGEIEPLSRLARPHAAIVTAIEPVHTEFFDSLDQIADAKAEIFAGLEPGGVAVLNRDNAYFDRLNEAASAAGVENVLSFGEHSAAKVRARRIVTDAGGSSIEADVDGATISYRLGMPGRHLAMNSLGVIAAVRALGADIELGVAALAVMEPVKGRGRQLSINVNGGHFTLIDESYNASPASMRAAMAVAALIEPRDGGRRIAVIGDMLELGDSAAQAHAALRDELNINRFDRVFAAGTLVESLWETLPRSMRAEISNSPERIAEAVAESVRPGDVVMVKGSLGSRVGVVVKHLAAMGEA